mgnify:CR=1 FL=1
MPVSDRQVTVSAGQLSASDGLEEMKMRYRYRERGRVSNAVGSEVGSGCSYSCFA